MRIFKKISVRFSLILKGISAFSTYCFLNNLYSTKYTTYALEQLTLWKILYVFCVCWLWEVNVVMTAASSTISKTQGAFSSFQNAFVYFRYNVFFTFCYCQWVSWYFLSRLKSVTGSFWKFVFKDLLTDCLSQFFQIILLMFGKNRFYVIANGMRMFIGVSFLLPFISLFLSSFSTVLMCLPNSSALYPVQEIVAWVLCSEVQSLCLIRSAWLYGILIFHSLNLYEGSSDDWLVFYILSSKDCCSWYTPLYLEKKCRLLMFCL